MKPRQCANYCLFAVVCITLVMVVSRASAQAAPAGCGVTDEFCYQPLVEKQLKTLEEVRLPSGSAADWMNQ